MLQEITMIVTVLPEVGMKDVPQLLSFHINQSTMKGISKSLTIKESHTAWEF
jgi:hypothetical protein